MTDNVEKSIKFQFLGNKTRLEHRNKDHKKNPIKNLKLSCVEQTDHRQTSKGTIKSECSTSV